MDLDRLILGSNPLYGVDHFSSQRARERSLQLKSDRIFGVVKASLSAGATGFNFSPHPIIYDILGELKEEGYGHNLGLYPMLPNAQTYITAQLNSGTVGMAKLLLRNLGVAAGARAIVYGGLSWLTTDPVRAMRLYIDIEITKLTDIAPSNAKIRVVLAHEVLSDLILALKMEEILRIYIEHLHDKHGLQAGFVTRNFPRFVQFCEESNLPLKDFALMTPFNRIGFQMTPNRESCEQTLEKLRGENVIGMSALAGGQLELGEAIEYLSPLKLKSLCVGVSTQTHAKETFQKLSQEFAT